MTKDDYEETLDIMKYADSIFMNEPIQDMYQTNWQLESSTNVVSIGQPPYRSSKSNLTRHNHRQTIQTGFNNMSVN